MGTSSHRSTQESGLDVVLSHRLTHRVGAEVRADRVLPGQVWQELVPDAFVHEDDFVVPPKRQEDGKQGQTLVPTEHIGKFGQHLGFGGHGQQRRRVVG